MLSRSLGQRKTKAGLVKWQKQQQLLLNAFIKNKNWQTQANLNQCVNCKIQEHAKGSGHVQTGYHRTRLKSDSKKANDGQKQDSQT